jgi:hypothetical protein
MVVAYDSRTSLQDRIADDEGPTCVGRPYIENGTHGTTRQCLRLSTDCEIAIEGVFECGQALYMGVFPQYFLSSRIRSHATRIYAKPIGYHKVTMLAILPFEYVLPFVVSAFSSLCVQALPSNPVHLGTARARLTSHL